MRILTYLVFAVFAFVSCKETPLIDKAEVTTFELKQMYFAQELLALQEKFDADTLNFEGLQTDGQGDLQLLARRQPGEGGGNGTNDMLVDELLTISWAANQSSRETNTFSRAPKPSKKCYCCEGGNNTNECGEDVCCTVLRLNDGDHVYSGQQLEEFSIEVPVATDTVTIGTIDASQETVDVISEDVVGYSYPFQLTGEYPPGPYFIVFRERDNPRRYLIRVNER